MVFAVFLPTELGNQTLLYHLLTSYRTKVHCITVNIIVEDVKLYWKFIKSITNLVAFPKLYIIWNLPFLQLIGIFSFCILLISIHSQTVVG